ncbi:MAG: DUF421 domain-containing protein [Firmicutes bacterium]|nr:DUF421 domain-containing protein [Bacillota bacterium]
MDYLVVLFRTLFFYILITLIYRFMGKREIGQLGIIDLIVSILIAEFAAVSIEQREEPLLMFVFPVFLLLVIQVVMSFISLKSKKVRDLFDGNPSVIINNGMINYKEMVKQRYNMEDLMTQLREKGIRSLEEVDFAILESSGNLSVFKKNSKLLGEYPLPVIIDGEIDYDTLRQLEINEEWIINYLDKYKIGLSDVFYGFYRNKSLFLIKKIDLRK